MCDVWDVSSPMDNHLVSQPAGRRGDSRHAQRGGRSARSQIGADSAGQVGNAISIGFVVAGSSGRLEHTGDLHEELHTCDRLRGGHGVPKNFLRQGGQSHHAA